MKYLYETVGAHDVQNKGTIEAGSEREALRQLTENGSVVVRLLPEKSSGKNFKRITRDELLLLFQELTSLLTAHVSLIDSVISLADGYHHAGIAAALQDIARSLEKGKSFSESLQGVGFNLPDYMYQLAAAGELTGKLADSLSDGVAQMEYESLLASDARGALIYPSILVVSGITAIAIVFAFVVPKFANLLETAEDLPLLAYIVLSTGTFVNSYGFHIIIGLAILASGILVVAGKRQIRLRLLDYASRWPVVGAWLTEAEAGRWTRLMGTLLGNDVALMDALALANRGVQLRGFSAKFEQVVRSVRGGVPLSTALLEQQALTSVAYHILRVGESSGQLPDMLKSLATLYATSGQKRLKRALTLIEPIAILLIGSVIAVVIIGIMLAITSAADIPL